LARYSLSYPKYLSQDRGRIRFPPSRASLRSFLFSSFFPSVARISNYADSSEPRGRVSFVEDRHALAGTSFFFYSLRRSFFHILASSPCTLRSSSALSVWIGVCGLRLGGPQNRVSTLVFVKGIFSSRRVFLRQMVRSLAHGRSSFERVSSWHLFPPPPEIKWAILCESWLRFPSSLSGIYFR